jgi:hypothetical protein
MKPRQYLVLALGLTPAGIFSYHIPAVLFFTLGLLAIKQKRLRLFYAIFVLGALNKAPRVSFPSPFFFSAGSVIVTSRCTI